MITAKNLTKVFGGKQALSIPELKISTGENVGVVGNNGAGKTTFFNLLLDLIPSSSGQILSKDQKVAGSEHWKLYTGSYLDEGFLIGFLSPMEYFEFVGSFYNLNKAEIQAFLANYNDFIGDELFSGKKLIRDLSKGNKSKVGIIGALMGKPEILVLDEPFAHLDPSSQIRLMQILSGLKGAKITSLVSSHDLKHVTQVCSRIILIDKGEIKKDIQTTSETLKELEEYFAV